MAQPFNFTFGQDFFNAYQQSQRQKEEERQFNLKFGEEQRQRSLLDAFKARAEQRDIEFQNASLANSQADNARANLNQAVDIQDKYTLQDKTNFFPYQSGQQALPNESLDVSSNPYLTGKVGIPKTTIPKEPAPHFQTDESGVVQKWNPTTQSFEATNIKARESGGLSALSEYNIRKDKEEKQNKIEQAQKMYDDIMDSWDDKVNGYVVRRPNGSPLVFKDEKSLKKYATSEVLKMKPPGKVNFWTREQTKGEPEDTEGQIKAYALKHKVTVSKARDLYKKFSGQ